MFTQNFVVGRETTGFFFFFWAFLPLSQRSLGVLLLGATDSLILMFLKKVLL